MKIVVAPDKFAGSLSAPEVAAAVARGWLSVRPGDEVIQIPLSDGGPGFIDCLAAGATGETVTVAVSGPLGVTVRADALAGSTWYIEAAQATGLHLIPASDRDPWRATSTGVGQLIAAAVQSGANRVVVGLGGSATDDGGAGALGALGARATADDASVVDLSGGPAALTHVARVDLSGARARMVGVDLVIASDVDNPLLGATGATMMFARQKGAAPEHLDALEHVMARWAHACVAANRGVGCDPKAPGAGAAGGLGFGLMTVGATRVSGIDIILDTTAFADRCRGADLVITGEGRLDEQSLHGKVVSGVVEAAGPVPVTVVAGQSLLDPAQCRTAGIAHVATLVERAADTADAMGRAAELVSEVAAALASDSAVPEVR